MKYLITGGLGFIGSKIIEKLSQKDNTICCVDNEDTYDIISETGLDKLIRWRTRNWKHENIQIIKGDVLDRDVCLKAFSKRPDIVIHLANRPPTRENSLEYPAGLMYENLHVTTRLMEEASQSGCKKFITVNESCVYPERQILPYKEKDLFAEIIFHP